MPTNSPTTSPASRAETPGTSGSGTVATPFAHVGSTRGSKDHDYDLVKFLSGRLDALWRFDQMIANAEGDSELQDFWRGIKRQEQGNVEHARELIKDHVRKNCF